MDHCIVAGLNGLEPIGKLNGTTAFRSWEEMVPNASNLRVLVLWIMQDVIMCHLGAAGLQAVSTGAVASCNHNNLHRQAGACFGCALKGAQHMRCFMHAHCHPDTSLQPLHAAVCYPQGSQSIDSCSRSDERVAFKGINIGTQRAPSSVTAAMWAGTSHG